MDPDPTTEPTPFFSDFKDGKNFLLKHFFSLNNMHTGTSSSVLEINFLLKFCVKNIVLQALFQSAQHIYEKREGSGAGSGTAPLTNGKTSWRYPSL